MTYAVLNNIGVQSVARHGEFGKSASSVAVTDSYINSSKKNQISFIKSSPCASAAASNAGSFFSIL